MPDPICQNTLGEAAVTWAVSQLGVVEVGGNNCGPEVEAYLANVGLSAGASWCAAFVFTAFRRAAATSGGVNPCPKTGGALKLWQLADKHFRLADPARGRVFVMDHGSGLGHVGLVEFVRADGSIDSIEGNTNAVGSRNGDRVARHGGWNPRDGSRGALVGFLDFDVPLPLVA